MRRVDGLFAAAALLLVLFFHHGLSGNAASRLLTVYALVEDHTLRADRFHAEGGDFAEIDHHIYSDKAPLSSFLVVPFYGALRALEGGAMSWGDQERANHLGVLLAAALPFAVFAWMLLVRLRREGLSPRESIWMAMITAFGSCLANYGGTYFGHMLAASLFLGSYVLACEREEHYLLAGALGGLAVLAEYPLALTQAIILGYLLLGKNRWRRALRYGLGALPSALAMVAYNKALTHQWLDFPYSHVGSVWQAMHNSFGFRPPTLEAMRELAFGQYRGLAFYAAPLLVAVPLLVTAFAGERRRRALVLVLMGSYFLLISSYFKWDGGWCLGPRHLAPVIALGLYEGVAALSGRQRWVGLFYALCAWSGAVSLAGSATESMPSEEFRSPAFEVFFPRVWAGHMSGHTLFFHLSLPNGGYVIAVWLALFFGITWGLARASAPHLLVCGSATKSLGPGS